MTAADDILNWDNQLHATSFPAIPCRATNVACLSLAALPEHVPPTQGSAPLADFMALQESRIQDIQLVILSALHRMVFNKVTVY